MTPACRPRELRPRARRLARERARRLVDAVVRLTGVAVADIFCSPAPGCFRLRAAAAWLIRRIDGLPYQEIALVLGRTEHSAARYLVARGEALRADEWPIRLLTDSIMGEHA